MAGAPGARRAAPGGITNANFVVDLGEEKVVVRVPGTGRALLGIDTATEIAASTLAAAIGVAPEIIAYDQELGCLVSRFLPARPIPPTEMMQEPMLGAVAATVKRVHHAGTVDTTFDYFTIIDQYHERAASRGRARAVRLRLGACRSCAASPGPVRCGPRSSVTTICSTPTSSSTDRCASSTGSTRA